MQLKIWKTPFQLSVRAAQVNLIKIQSWPGSGSLLRIHTTVTPPPGQARICIQTVTSGLQISVFLIFPPSFNKNAKNLNLTSKRASYVTKLCLDVFSKEN